MMKKQINLICLCTVALTIFTPLAAKRKRSVSSTKPKLTIVLVIDQFAYTYVRRLQKFFQYGLKDLFDDGIIYTNAYVPHGTPETTTGHNTLSTGVLPKNHGAITNQWLDEKGNKIHWETDTSGNATLLIPNADPAKGKSGHNTVVDGLSDQFTFSPKGVPPNKVFSFALKSYPAIAMANKTGKAIWFEETLQGFTSSERFFSELPVWLAEFNSSDYMKKLKASTWQLMYPESDPAYDFPLVKNHDFAGLDHSLIGYRFDEQPKPGDVGGATGEYAKKYSLFVKTPMASEALLELAKECVKQNLSENGDDKMLLWVSLSNFDLAGHLFGPDSIEMIDMTYQIDKQIKNFMNFVEDYVGKKNYLLMLTADHGVAPIPEIQKLKGYNQARRIDAKTLIKDINDMVFKTFGITDLVITYEPSSFKLAMDKLMLLPREQQQDVLKKIVDFLKEYPGIAHAWTYDELDNKTFEPEELGALARNQLYFKRTGEIVCQSQPYCLITHYPTGTSHATPYEYDTHIPLVLYQSGRLEQKTIHDKVWMPQFAPTLSKLLGIQKPCASTCELLPGIF